MRASKTKVVKMEVQSNKKLREQIKQYLFPHTPYALFLLSNIGASLTQAEYYVALDDLENIKGVGAYFPLFGSCSIFTEEPEISSKLADTISSEHSIKYLLGIEEAARPAFDTLVQSGYRSIKEPRHVFMEVDLSQCNFVPH